ncbi:hypothetical protein B9Z55_014162 [Caenorhabditis nigoni]|uniref:Protein cereblon n=1 Tax=Caenorhabditis nigoni TaxID=1611254 RepID=A0A2G5U4S1_9PELO|nr:hypothetical protein B9Z55_014162 [Caenorhabditis nigoni]
MNQENDQELNEVNNDHGDERDHLEGFNPDAAHRFDYTLQDNENRENYKNEAKLVDYGTNWFPICGVSAVCFPEQQLPMKFNEDEQELYDRLVASARANGFVVLFPSDIRECDTLPYVATLSKVVQANPQTLSMELMGVHRCKVLSYNLENGEAFVQLLPEVEIPALLSKHLPKYSRRYSMYEKRSLATRITGYPFDSLRDISRNQAEQCCLELNGMIGEEVLQQALNRGLTYFSYFISQQIFSNRETEYSLLKEDSANTRIAAALKYCKVSIGKCRRCFAPIFLNENIMRLPEQTMTHVNAHGFVHKITLLSSITNYVRASAPSYEFTWFPDYAWIIIQCVGCHQHLGWEYMSMTREPQRFFGIQREGVQFENDDGNIYQQENIAEEMEEDNSDLTESSDSLSDEESD